MNHFGILDILISVHFIFEAFWPSMQLNVGLIPKFRGSLMCLGIGLFSDFFQASSSYSEHFHNLTFKKKE